MRRALALAAVVAIATLSSPAFAGEAARLFDEGVKLLDAGRVAEACPKLEESQRLEPAAGTLLNLAACYERSGRRVLALTTFRAAAEAAHARGRADWERTADEHAQALAATIPTLTITTTDARASLEVRVDGAVVNDAPLPLEPGTHTVAATSKGMRPFSVKVAVTKSTVVVVPALEPVPELFPEPVSPPSASGLGTRRFVGIGLAAVGVGALVFSGASALVASSALDEAKASCPSYPTRCSRAAAAPNDRAEMWSTIATVSAIAGVALAVGGGVLYFLPSSDGARVALRASF